MGKSRKLSKSESYDYLVKQVAPSKIKYHPGLGNIRVADTASIYLLPKTQRDVLVRNKAKELGIRIDSVGFNF